MGRWCETGVLRDNHLTHPQAELGLSHMFNTSGLTFTWISTISWSVRPGIIDTLSTRVGLVVRNKSKIF